MNDGIPAEKIEPLDGDDDAADDYDQFHLAVYAATVENDPGEDAVWECYRAENIEMQGQAGFVKEVLAHPAEDVWNAL